MKTFWSCHLIVNIKLPPPNDRRLVRDSIDADVFHWGGFSTLFFKWTPPINANIFACYKMLNISTANDFTCTDTEISRNSHAFSSCLFLRPESPKKQDVLRPVRNSWRVLEDLLGICEEFLGIIQEISGPGNRQSLNVEESCLCSLLATFRGRVHLKYCIDLVLLLSYYLLFII